MEKRTWVKSKLVTIKRLMFFFIIAIIVFMFSTFSYSVKNEKKKETLLFLGNENIAPLIYKENNETKGLVVDIVKELSKKIGRNIEVEAIDWEKAQNKMLSGKADALLQINPNSEREKLYDFSTEVLKSEFSIFKKSENIDINDVYDLKDKRVGVEAVGYPRYLLGNYNNINTIIISDWIVGFKKIDEGLLDALVVDRWIGEYALAKSKVGGIQIVAEPIETRDSHIAVIKGDENLLKTINKGLEEMKKDGTMYDILNQWRGESIVYFTKDEIKKNAYYIMFGVFIIIIAGVVFLVMKLREINRQLELKVIERTDELYKTNEKLMELSMIDGLTKIYNRRHFDSIFKKTWQMSLRKEQALSLILLDIDYFKKYNDTYGHLAGDYCLKIIANILKNSARRSGDAIARFGGEEFIIMLFDTPEEGAMVLAEEVRNTIENTNIVYESKMTSVTASLGVVTVIPNEDLDPMDLIELADKAMYKAKKDGRNKVIIATEDI